MRDLVVALFTPPPPSRHATGADRAIGAELELIPVSSATKQRVGVNSAAGQIGTAEIIRVVALERGWREVADAYGAPSWELTGGGRISYEPGGQIEISSPVCNSADELISFLYQAIEPLRTVAAASGIDLLAVGVDPYNSIDQVPAQFRAPRYDNMARHFERIGPAGVRMMRQTASLQINVELGAMPLERWRLLNSIAPYLTAAFANSRMYAGEDTGHPSHRALIWQQLDPSRTGLPYNAAHPIDAYASFAEGATRILSDDAAHLSTLFPEVRPRGYFELRSIDAVELDRAAQAIRFVAALTTSARATQEALQLLGEPDASRLYIAATVGRSDPAIDSRIRELERIAGVSISEKL